MPHAEPEFIPNSQHEMNQPPPQSDDQPSANFATSCLQKSTKFLVTFSDMSTVLAGAVALFAFAARYSWAAELCCQFRVQLLFFLGPAAVAYWIWRRGQIAWWVLLCAVANLIPLSPYLMPTAKPVAAADAVVTRVMLMNVLEGNSHHDEVVSYVLENDPDIFFALESDQDWTEGLQSIHSTYPHRHLIDDRGTASIAVYSRIPFDSIEVRHSTRHKLPSLDLSLSIDGQPLQFVVTHPYVPLTEETARMRNEQLTEIAQWAAQDRSRILIGDYNCTPWSPHFTDLLKEANVTPAGYGSGLRPTWYRRARAYGPLRQTWLFALKLDHVLLSDDLAVVDHRIGPCLGSDHRPVTVDFARIKTTQ